ncbi:hypothetical protein [Erythrobacter sp.]|uniref:hypothetical protein n=1 Tax=Erythrobacter sp. TaxID=1042 RepID=UPI0025F10DEE|nr:hypothetical protein [Erythrobacter sp.]
MASLPPEPILPASVAPLIVRHDPAALVQQWEALHLQAAQLAALAQIASENELTAFARLAEQARGWQLQLAAQGLEDIAAMLRPGLAALATLTARGQDAAAPALALWREFHAARASVLASLQVVEAV